MMLPPPPFLPVSSRNRRWPFGLVVLWFVGALNPLQAESYQVGGEKQLFIDSTLIAHSRDVALTMNPAVKTEERNIVADRPWEQFYAGGFNTVLEDDGIYKLWYESRTFRGEVRYDHLEKYICYATSRDGIHWDKPRTGVVEFDGSKDNNILLPGVVGTVFIDPRKTGGEKYKFAGRTDGRGLWIWTSPDGLNWRTLVDHPVLSKGAFDTQNQVFWDDRLQKYVAYVRRGNDARPGDPNAGDPVFKDGKLVTTPEQMPDPNNLRKVGRSESSELARGWNEPEIVFAYDKQDPAGSDHYNPCVIKYPYAANAYFMFPSAMAQYPDNPSNGPLDIQMATSRDGVHWTRLDRRPYVRLGLNGADDGGSIYMTVGMIRHGAELWMYYTGFPFTHGGFNLNTTRNSGVVRRLIQRLDGFVSADAAWAGGELTTVPLHFKGSHLALNIDTGALGSTRVEILDASGKVIPGYAAADCEVIITNDVEHLVQWKGQPNLSALMTQPVKLRFLMRSTKLYAFQFVDRP